MNKPWIDVNHIKNAQPPILLKRLLHKLEWGNPYGRP
jgi:hypothetical protein